MILLIDEYDVPLAKAQSNGYYRQMPELIRRLMSTSLMTNEYLKFAVVTGCLRIPNRKISSIFQTTVVDHFKRTVNQMQIQDLMKALWSGDVSMASSILSDLLWHTISNMDYYEDYYHAFLTGIFVGRGGILSSQTRNVVWEDRMWIYGISPPARQRSMRQKNGFGSFDGCGM